VGIDQVLFGVLQWVRGVGFADLDKNSFDWHPVAYGQGACALPLMRPMNSLRAPDHGI